MTEATTRTKAVAQRFIDAYYAEFLTQKYIGRSAMVWNLEASAKEFAHEEMAESATRLFRRVEEWLGPEFQFSHLIDGHCKVADSEAERFNEMLKLRAFVYFNVQHLRRVVFDLRCGSPAVLAFDQQVSKEDGVHLLLNSAEHSWYQIGAPGFVRRAAELLRTRFAIEIKLLSEDEALEQMQAVLDGLAEEYEKLKERAFDLQRQAIAAAANKD
jgi:hypothetical protein